MNEYNILSKNNQLVYLYILKKVTKRHFERYRSPILVIQYVVIVSPKGPK